MGAYIRHVDFADYAVFFAREEMSRFHPAAQSLPPSESDGLNSPGPGAGIMGRLIETLVRVTRDNLMVFPLCPPRLLRHGFLPHFPPLFAYHGRVR